MNTATTFPARLGLQQRVLPDYRVPFFDMLAQACQGGLSLFAGLPRAGEGITRGQPQTAKYFAAENHHLFNGSLYLCYQSGWIDWLNQWDPAALIVEANPRYPATPSGVRWMHQRGRKVIAWGLGSPQGTGLLAGMQRSQWRQFIRQFDALISYSERGAGEYAALGFPPEKIFVAPNAVAPRPQKQPKHPSRMTQVPTVLFVGRLQARKRLDHLIRACAQMPEPRPRLVIVGDGPQRHNLEILAKEEYPAAQFVGARHGAELQDYFASADLFVLPGTGGLAIQEAMAHGLPIIAARGDGTQNDLVREANGWQVQPDDYDALVNALRLALSDIKRLRSMGAESYRIVYEEINLEQMVNAFIRALNSLM